MTVENDLRRKWRMPTELDGYMPPIPIHDVKTVVVHKGHRFLPFQMVMAIHIPHRAWARPTRMRNTPWLIFVFSRYSSAIRCLSSPGRPSTTGIRWARAYAGDDCIALPVASDAFCPESHRFPLVVATTTENHLHYDTTQNSHSAGCDPHSRNDLLELPDITCLVPRPWSATLPEPHSTWQLPRQGPLFRSAVFENAYLVTPQLDNSPTSFVSRNVADLVQDDILAISES